MSLKQMSMETGYCHWGSITAVGSSWVRLVNACCPDSIFGDMSFRFSG